ncbi:hypothetical protein H0H87_008862 [Tephrocybe sp. NHM501043]|nr:hypothetical protein H0H87_008862 [Tephrocybe sp. NHM501043]
MPKSKKVNLPESASQNRITKGPLPKAHNVPRPNIDRYTNDLLTSNSPRSPSSREKLTIALAKNRAKKFLLFAPKFRTPWKLERLDIYSKEEMQARSNALARPHISAQSFSAQYVDETGRPVFYYLGEREMSDSPSTVVPWSFETQSKIASQLATSPPNKKYFDGLNNKVVKRYHEATQTLCSVVHPHIIRHDVRHPIDKEDHEPRVMRYKNLDDMNEKAERCGVLHLVHGWTQQAQPNKATSLLSKLLGAWFQVLFPSEYQRFAQAFEAGVWIEDDPGPWLGRSIVYKLQVDFHVDAGDDGPAVSFPVGFFQGGHLVVPALYTKFSYQPGHVCFFYASKMYHSVTRWIPDDDIPGQELTPGRIGTVFFSPANSLNILKDKPQNWARKTAMGRAPDPTNI